MEPDNLAVLHPFLAGGGETGELIRSINWSDSPIGPIDNWPPHLRTTLNIILNSGFPMFLFWGPALICFYNDAYRRSLGNDGKHPSAMGQPGETVWPETWSVSKPIIEQVLVSGEANWSEDQLFPLYRNGRTEDTYWTYSYSPVNDEFGTPDGVLLTCLETTETVASTRQLKESGDLLFAAVDAADIATWDLNPGTDRFVGNDLLKDWFGLPLDEEISLSTALRSIIDDDKKRVIEAIANALQPSSGGLYDITYTIVNAKTGRERVVRAKGRAYFDTAGTAYRFVGTTQDITGQVLAREQVRRAEQMAQLAVAGAGAGTFFIDLTDNTISYSPTLSVVFTGLELTGLTRDSLLTYILPEDRPIREAAYRLASQTGKLTYEARTVWHDGSIHWLRVVGAYFYDTKGTATGFSGITIDITAQRMAQQELERQVEERTKELSDANKALVRTNHELEQFAYIASHDLQEPLRKIQSFADLLQSNWQNTSSVDLYLSKITKSAQRMSALIKAVLDYSRLAATNDLFEKVDLNQTLQTVLADFDLLIEQKGAVIQLSTLPVLVGIPLQISQLFTNLIGNALKFTAEEPRITISATSLLPRAETRHPGLNPALAYAELTVQDNGIGFDQQYAERIFALFQRLGGAKVYSGTGIGLALCKKIVENHGGLITAESAPGRGATFRIYLPVSQPKTSQSVSANCLLHTAH